MLLKKEECEIVFNVIKARFIINPMYSEFHQDEEGNTQKLIEIFFLFLKERGYILKKHKAKNNVSYRTLEEYKNDNGEYNFSIYKDNYSEKKIREKKMHRIIDIYEDGKDVFKIFIQYVHDKHPELVKDYFNFVSFSIYITDYLFFFLNSLQYSLSYNKKYEKICLGEEILEYRKQISDSFFKMLENEMKNKNEK